MEDSLGIRDLIAAFFRQFKVFFLIVLATVSVGLLVIIFSTPMYQATGSVLVKFGSDADARVNNPNDNTPVTQADRREIMQSNLDILQSHDLLKAVITKIGIERIYPGLTEIVGTKDSPMEVAIFKMQNKHLIIKSSPQSNVIDIKALNTSPEIAAEIVSNLQSIFIQRQLEIFNKPQTNFLMQQVKESQDKLTKSQNELRAFKSGAGLSSIEEELNELLKQKSSAVTVAFQAVDDAQGKLEELRDKETEMLTTYRPDSPPMVAIRKSIAEAARQLQERQENLTASKSGTLSDQNARINKRIAKLEEQRNHYNDLVRQVEVNETNYKNYLARSEEARINETLGEKKITSISIVDAPTIPMKPATPRKFLTVVISLLAGIILGGLVALAREIFDESFRTPKQLAKVMQLPVLTSFPSREGLMQLYNNIEHLLANIPQPIIQFVSSYDGEGADDIAQDLAELATQQGKNVLLVNTEKLQRNFGQAHFEFSNRYNNSWTIIPSSGLLRNEVGQSLAKLASGSVLVVEAEHTRAPVAREVKRMIESLGGKVVGAVMVKRRLYIPMWIYNRLYKVQR